jgi:GTP cyclohydrolase II
MSAAPMPAQSAIFGSREHLDVSRAVSELQARRPVRVSTSDESLIALPVEGLDHQRLHEFAMLRAPAIPKLIVTQQRARAIGIETSTPMALSLPGTVNASGIIELAAGSKGHFTVEAEAASYAATAAIRPVKLVRGLPAILTARVTAIDGDMGQSIAAVEADAVIRFAADQRLHWRWPARRPFRWHRGHPRASSCFGMLSASIRSLLLSAIPTHPNACRFDFTRHV